MAASSDRLDEGKHPCRRFEGAGSYADLDHLFHLAETHTVQNLRRVLAEGEAVAGMRCVQLRFTPKQYEQFAAALRRHGAKPARGRGLRGMEEALMDLIA